ncbi:DNA glycosylase/AP lyase [Chlamydoabsidia padenii]|nr:DNA glycosylase/AP lyase [Chlamydoabsidia padenii]
MPEIAEVEHARRECHKNCLLKKIRTVETVSDDLTFVDITHDAFGKALEGRTMVDTKRWGKYFVLLFDQGPHVVAHFGMTGSIKFKHDLKPKEEWPPRFWKTIITFENISQETTTMAYCDPRRLGRLRLVSGDPLTCEPISKLGFDPLHNLPSLEDFTAMVRKRAVPIKALLLDQGFSAGVGNWIADEILYHSRLHPAQYSNSLTNEECDTLRQQMEKVCRIAVEAEADESLLPDDWLMTYRWNKGKGKGAGVLPNGHKLAFETVGGRTSAYAPALQKLRGSTTTKKTPSRKRQHSSLSTPLNDNDDENTTTIKEEDDNKRIRKTRSAVTIAKASPSSKAVSSNRKKASVKTSDIKTEYQDDNEAKTRRTSSRLIRSTNDLK